MDMSNDMSPEWLTVQEVATHFRVSTRTVTRWVSSDPNMRVRRVGPAGRIIRIHRSELKRESNLPVPAA